jgi:Flp pilus assembly protein TadB
MAVQDELVQLEAERDRLLSMIAYHDRPMMSQAPSWFRLLTVAMICVFLFLIVAGISAGQVQLSAVVFLVVFVGLAAYILTRKMTLFGVTFRIGDMFAEGPVGQPAGEPQIRQRLAGCEARIERLREG